MNNQVINRVLFQGIKMLYYHTAIIIGKKIVFIINHRLMMLLLIISMYIYITVNRNNICSQFYEEMITMKNERFD